MRLFLPAVLIGHMDVKVGVRCAYHGDILVEMAENWQVMQVL